MRIFGVNNSKNEETEMNDEIPTVPAKTGKASFYISWGLRVIAALAFISAGGAKLAGVEAMVDLFDQVGVGQWFRILTGVVEVGGAIALLVPRTVGFGALLLAATMVGAIITHLFVIGGSPVPAIVLLVVCSTIAWLNRGQLANAATR